MAWKKGDWQSLLKLLDLTQHKHVSLIFHHYFFQVILTIFSFFVLTSTNSVFAKSLLLSINIHLLVDEIIAYKNDPRSLQTWLFARESKQFALPSLKYYLYFFAFTCLLLTLILVFWDMNPQLFLDAKKYLKNDQDELLDDVESILKYIEYNHINDYSFVVAPAAKAYEGYLKDFFFDIDIIDEYSYHSNRFRVGKTLNPSLRYKRYSIFKKLADLHQDGEQLAEKLWTAWKQGRNEIFHYFPGNVKKLTRPEAEECITLILKAIIDSGNFINLYKNEIIWYNYH